MTDMETTVDNAVFLGSAGLAQEQVKDVNNGKRHLAVSPENIAYTRATEDTTAPLGYGFLWMKEPPADINGTVEISAEGGYSRSGHYFQDTDGHGLYGEKNGLEGYLDENTSSRYQTSLWTTGHQDQIGQLLDYDDPADGDTYHSPQGDITTYHNDRRDLSSPEGIEKLRKYAERKGIDWEEVQDGEPGTKNR